MNNLSIEEKEIYKIDNKEFTVITKVSNDCLNKDKLIKLIAGYAMQELKQEDWWN